MAANFFSKRAKLVDYIAENTDATADETQDITGAVGNLGILIVEVDNTNNASTAVHAKLYDDGSDINVGSDAPDLIFRVQGGVKRQFIGLTDGMGNGTPDFSHLAIAAVTEAGQAGTTSPTNDVTVRVGIKSTG